MTSDIPHVEGTGFIGDESGIVNSPWEQVHLIITSTESNAVNDDDGASRIVGYGVSICYQQPSSNFNTTRPAPCTSSTTSNDIACGHDPVFFNPGM